MADRDVVEKAANTKNGDKFTKLYNGESVLGREEKDERSLMSRLAIHCGSDKEKLLRVFKSSGQFREEKPDSFYDKLANESMEFVNRSRKNTGSRPSSSKVEGKSLSFGNAKKTGHRYQSTIIHEATCTEEGLREFVCEICGHTYSSIIPALGHQYELVESWVENGETFHKYTCKICGDTYI